MLGSRTDKQRALASAVLLLMVAAAFPLPWRRLLSGLTVLVPLASVGSGLEPILAAGITSGVGVVLLLWAALSTFASGLRLEAAAGMTATRRCAAALTLRLDNPQGLWSRAPGDVLPYRRSDGPESLEAAWYSGIRAGARTRRLS
jgi:hypothetical protein